METGQVITIAAIVLVPAILLWVVLLVRSGRPGKPSVALGIPQAMRPAAPDEVLEGPRLQRIQFGWVLATLATAAFIPIYWLPEAQRQESYVERFGEEATHRGQLIFGAPPPLPEDASAQEFKEAERALALGQGCAGCHGGAEIPEGGGPEDLANGGFAQPCNVCPVDPLTGNPTVQYRAPPLQNVFQRWDEEVIRFTIERGRPGTPMPAWGVEFGGSMTDLMIDDVIAWMKTLPGNQQPPPPLSDRCENLPSPNPSPTGGATGATGPTQTELTCGREIFQARCAVCHGPRGQGKEERPDRLVNPDGTPQATWYQGMALWKGDVRHLPTGLNSGAFAGSHLATITNGRRFAFMPAFGEVPSQGIPVPPYPLSDAQIRAVMAYERTL